MSFSLMEQIRKRRILKGYLIFAFVLTTVYAVVCTPLNLILTSNVLMMKTILPITLDVVMSFMNFAFYWGSFAYLLFYLYQEGLSASKPFLISYVALVFYRYITSMLASFLVLGFPPFDSFLSFTLPYFLFDIFMDLLQLTVLCFLSHKVSSQGGMLKAYMPFQKTFDRQNALCLNILKAALIPAIISILSRLIYDVNYGFPKDTADLIWMLTYYLADLLCILVGYIVIMLFLNSLYLKDLEQKSEKMSSIFEE